MLDFEMAMRQDAAVRRKRYRLTDGAARLTRWMSREKLNGVTAAAGIGIDPTTLSHFLSGRRTPSLATAVTIEAVTGIPAKAWAAFAESDSAVGQTPTKA